MDTEDDIRKKAYIKDHQNECCRCGSIEDEEDMENQFFCGEYITHKTDWYCCDCMAELAYEHFKKCEDCSDEFANHFKKTLEIIRDWGKK